MILHGFCWRSLKNTLFWQNILICNWKSKKYKLANKKERCNSSKKYFRWFAVSTCPPGQVLASPDMSKVRVLIQFCIFRVKNWVSDGISKWFCIVLPGEAEKHVFFSFSTQNHTESSITFVKKSVFNPQRAKFDQNSDFGHVRTCQDLSKRTSTYCKPADILFFSEWHLSIFYQQIYYLLEHH